MKKILVFLLTLVLVTPAVALNLPPGAEILTSPSQIKEYTILGQVGATGSPGSYLYGVKKELIGGTLPVAGVTYTLAGSGITASATSITLTSLTIPQTGYELLDADFSSTFYVTLEPGNAKRQEIVSCTTVTQNANNSATLSGCSRGLLPFSPYTASTSYAFPHAGGTSLIFSDPPQLFNEYPAKANDETVTGNWTYSNTTTFNTLPLIPTTTPTSPQHPVSLDYLTTVTSTGCANASTAVRGCVEEAANSEVLAGTTAGGTGSQLYINPSSWLENADTHLSNNLTVGEDVGAYSILYTSTTGSYFTARASVQGQVDRISAVAYESKTSGNTPRVLFPGSYVVETTVSSSAGYNFAGSGGNDTSVGTRAWNGVGNITAQDGVYATTTLLSGTTNYLSSTNYGFNIPSSATINGIEVVIRRKIASVSSVVDNSIRLIKSASFVGNSKTEFWYTSDTDSTFGANNDLWGTTWTPAEVNATNFGVGMSIITDGSVVASVDSMKIRVYYTIPPYNLTTSSPVYLSDDGRATSTPGTIRKVLGTALGANLWQFNPTIDTPIATPTASKIPIADTFGTLNSWVTGFRTLALNNASSTTSVSNNQSLASTTISANTLSASTTIRVIINVSSHSVFNPSDDSYTVKLGNVGILTSTFFTGATAGPVIGGTIEAQISFVSSTQQKAMLKVNLFKNGSNQLSTNVGEIENFIGSGTGSINTAVDQVLNITASSSNPYTIDNWRIIKEQF